MKGLILKDLINLRRQAKIIGVLFAFYMILSITSKDSSFFGGIVALLCALLPVTALSYDERSKWDKYALSMPVSRADIVISKYLLGAIFSVVAFLINIVFSLAISEASLGEILLTSIALSAVGLLFLCIILPILFKFGVEKGRLLMMLVIFAPTAFIVLASNRGWIDLNADSLEQLSYIVPLLVLAVFFISIFISLKIYKKKEL